MKNGGKCRISPQYPHEVELPQEPFSNRIGTYDERTKNNPLHCKTEIGADDTARNVRREAIEGWVSDIQIRPLRDYLEDEARNYRREAKAHALIEAVMNCDPLDRLPFLEAILQGLRAGMPIAAFGQIMREANFWAENAGRAELKAYCAAAFAQMPPEDQNAFRAFIDRERAAA